MRTYPKCRSDRAYVETCKLNRLTGIAPLLDGTPQDEDDGDRDDDYYTYVTYSPF